MIAITIIQPWASLIVAGEKDVENRTWKTNHRGTILVHAGKTKSQEDYNEAHEIMAAVQNRALHIGPFPYGAILGTVEIVDCTRSYGSIWANPQQWNWVLRNAVRFAEPIPWSGKLGFFDVPDDAIARVARSA